MLGLHVRWTHSGIDLERTQRSMDRRCRLEIKFLISQLASSRGEDVNI